MDMPSALVLIVCRTVLIGEPDINSKWTGYESRDWDFTHATMHCKREVIELYDSAAAQGANPQPFTKQQCQKAGIVQGVLWDQQHRGSNYRFFRAACPVPVVDTRTGKVISYVMPDCGRVNGVRIECEKDSVI